MDSKKGIRMALIVKKNDAGFLLINKSNLRMLLKTENENIIDQKRIAEILYEKRIPITAQLEVTQNCNYNCYYCYAKALRKKKQMELRQIKRIIDIIHENNFVYLELTGGEPLSRKDIIDIIRYANEKEMIINLITNGSYLTKEICIELKKGLVNRIQLSLLAPTKERCEQLTGYAGSYEKVIEAIELLKKYELPFVVSATLTNQNIDLFHEFEAFEKKYNINIAFAIDVMPAIDNYSIFEKYSLKRENMKQIAKIIKERSELFESEIFCGAGREKIAIDYEGNVLPCLKYRKAMGNILKDDFVSIWNSEQILYDINNVLVQDSDCKNCKEKEFCQNKCPAIYMQLKNKMDRCSLAKCISQISNRSY